MPPKHTTFKQHVSETQTKQITKHILKVQGH